MNGIEFINKLKSQLPTLAAFNISGHSMDILQNSIDSLQLTDKNPSDLVGDVILDMLKQYDCSKVEIGMLAFSNEIAEDSLYYYIGNVEVDILVKNKHTGAVQLLEYDQPSHILCDCAKDSSAFLEALTICDKYFWECVLDKSVFDDEKKGLVVVEECAYIAGGESYYGFYAMLMG